MSSNGTIDNGTAQAAPSRPQHLLGVVIENFQGLRFVEVGIDSDIVQVSGPNGAGKTSLIDAIEFLLGPMSGTNAEPVRRGADKCRVVGTLGDYIVTATMTKTGTRNVKVTDREGNKVDMSSQRFLELLRLERCFDVGAFYRLPSRDQADEMRRVLGLSDPFAQLDAEIADASNLRLEVGRELKTIEGALALCPSVDGPDEEHDVETLNQSHAAALAQIEANNKQRKWLAESRETVASLATQIEEAKKKLAALQAMHEVGVTEIESSAPAIDALVDPDVNAIVKQLGELDKLNRVARQRKERLNLLDKQQRAAARQGEQQRRIEDARERKRQLLAQTNIPVKGVTFDDEGNLRVDGVPFSQVNRARQILISAHVAMRQAPNLRVMLVRDADLMQPPIIKMLCDLARQFEFQLFLEVAVSKAPEGQNIILEEGSVVSAKTIAAQVGGAV